MNLSSRITFPPARPNRAAAALLGAGHPLVRDLDRLTLVVNQSAIVGAILTGAIGALLAGWSHPLPVVVGAAGAAVLLACRAALLISRTRAHALELIAHGRGALPIPAIERTRIRLRQPRHRDGLIERIEALRDGTGGPFDVVTTPWQLARPELVAPIRAELTEIARLLREPHADPQGIALIEQLLVDGTSVLHSADVGMLQDELRRVRFLLAAS